MVSFVTVVITIMVTTKKPHACLLIDSLLGAWYMWEANHPPNACLGYFSTIVKPIIMAKSEV